MIEMMPTQMEAQIHLEIEEDELDPPITETTTGRNLQSYLSTARLRKLTVVFKYCEAMETYSRI